MNTSILLHRQISFIFIYLHDDSRGFLIFFFPLRVFKPYYNLLLIVNQYSLHHLFVNTAVCPDPGVPNQGMRVGDNFQHGKTVTFECKKNYDLLGNATVRCNGGVWNGETPKCKGNYKNNP